MTASVYSNTTLIGHTDLQVGDESMGCVFGNFIPTNNYDKFVQKSVWNFWGTSKTDYKKWHSLNERIALPIWTKQRNQKIAIVDVANLTITTFKKEFRVLFFNKFLDNNLSGVDSPIYMTTKLIFDISKEEIEIIKQLK